MDKVVFLKSKSDIFKDYIKTDVKYYKLFYLNNQYIPQSILKQVHDF